MPTPNLLCDTKSILLPSKVSSHARYNTNLLDHCNADSDSSDCESRPRKVARKLHRDSDSEKSEVEYLGSRKVTFAHTITISTH
jgi:hypothetical protein